MSLGPRVGGRIGMEVAATYGPTATTSTRERATSAWIRCRHPSHLCGVGPEVLEEEVVECEDEAGEDGKEDAEAAETS